MFRRKCEQIDASVDYSTYNNCDILLTIITVSISPIPTDKFRVQDIKQQSEFYCTKVAANHLKFLYPVVDVEQEYEVMIPNTKSPLWTLANTYQG